jgi:putative DNA primase/helicase
MDVLVDFLRDRCATNPDSRAPSKDLYGAYTLWCQENGQEAIKQRGFASGLKEKGFSPIRFRGVRGWQGLELV